MINQDSERSLLDRLFEASYDPFFTDVNKEELKRKLIERLDEITNKIYRNQPGNELIRELDLRIVNNMRFEKDTLFAIDFALRGRGDCLVYADLIFTALEHIDRKDVIENLNVKYTGEAHIDHIRLVFNDGSTSFELLVFYPYFYFPSIGYRFIEIFNKGEKSDKKHNIEYLIAANWFNKGRAFHRISRFKKAIECYNKSLELNPYNDNVWNMKGAAHSAIGEVKKAIECYNKSLELNPYNDTANFNKMKAIKKLESQISYNSKKTD